MSQYALSRILYYKGHNDHKANDLRDLGALRGSPSSIDPESRFYVIWKWSYADAKVPADESFKLSQALGLATETLWDKTGVWEKSGENVQATPVAKRIKVKNLGEPAADGAPASVIDVLHRMCAYPDPISVVPHDISGDMPVLY